MKDIGLRVSKLTKSALNGVIKDTLLTSEYPFLKTFKQGEAAVNVTGAGTFSVQIDHNLGYHPIFIHLQAVDPNSPERRYLGRFAAQQLADFIGVDSYITRSTLTLAWYDNSAAPGSFRSYPYVVTFYYYIFYDPLENL